MIELPAAEIRRHVRQGLAEDLSRGDMTTSSLFAEFTPARARLIAEQSLVVAGMAAAVQTFLTVDSTLRLSVKKADGASATKGETLMSLEGDGRSILMAERVALNFLQHLSGIATLTRQFCHAVRGYSVSIMDTRKTLPGWRALQKWAVALGGGKNHRSSLADGMLIKDNHLALLADRQSVIVRACQAARVEASPKLPVIVEVERLRDVGQALEGKAEIILLDNMTPAQVRKAVTLIDGRAMVEVSGGITLANVRAMAAAGVNRISIGALTHSAPAATLGLTLERDITSKRRL